MLIFKAALLNGGMFFIMFCANASCSCFFPNHLLLVANGTNRQDIFIYSLAKEWRLALGWVTVSVAGCGTEEGMLGNMSVSFVASELGRIYTITCAIVPREAWSGARTLEQAILFLRRTCWRMKWAARGIGGRYPFLARCCALSLACCMSAKKDTAR